MSDPVVVSHGRGGMRQFLYLVAVWILSQCIFLLYTYDDITAYKQTSQKAYLEIKSSSS